MEGNKRVLETLNVRLSEELAAVSQYMVHSEICSNWGYSKLAGYIKKRAIDEMIHAEKLIERIIFLGGIPIVSNLKGLNIASDVKGIFANDHEGEQDTIDNYNESISICVAVKDFGTRELLGSILKDEERHIDSIEANLAQIEMMGLQLYLTEQID